MAQYTLKMLSDELGVTYEAVRRLFWRRQKRGDLEGHWKKTGATIYVDDVGADVLRSGHSQGPAVIIRDGETERIHELTRQVENLKIALNAANADRATAYKALSEALAESNRLLEQVNEYKLQLMRHDSGDQGYEDADAAIVQAETGADIPHNSAEATARKEWWLSKSGFRRKNRRS